MLRRARCHPTRLLTQLPCSRHSLRCFRQRDCGLLPSCLRSAMSRGVYDWWGSKWPCLQRLEGVRFLIGTASNLSANAWGGKVVTCGKPLSTTGLSRQKLCCDAAAGVQMQFVSNQRHQGDFCMQRKTTVISSLTRDRLGKGRGARPAELRPLCLPPALVPPPKSVFFAVAWEGKPVDQPNPHSLSPQTKTTDKHTNNNKRESILLNRVR